MTETGYFQGGANNLYYISAGPDNGCQPEHGGVIFVHAADGNRLGPHRMFVELSEQLNMSGFATMRFDLSGCGDSDGVICRKSISQDVKDVIAAIDFFSSKTKNAKLYLIGISRGARVCLSLLMNNHIHVTGAILLSPPVATNITMAKSLFFRIREYYMKLKDPQTLKKLLKGEINFRQILKTFTVAIGVKNRYKNDNTGKIVSKCPLLFIFGQNDPIAAESKTHYKRICNQHGITSKFITISQANHSFFHYKWKEQIFEIVQSWLAKTNISQTRISQIKSCK